MCGIAGYSLAPRLAARPDARRAGAAGRDRRARRRRRRLRLPRPGERGAVGRQAAHAGLGAPRARRGAGRARPSCSCTSATTPRAIPRSRPTTTRSATGPWSGSTTGIILNDDELLAEHDCARAEPGMTVDSEAIFAVAAHSRERRAGARGAARRDGRRLARRAPARRRAPRPRRRPPALARRMPRRRLLRLDRVRARGCSSATAGSKLRKRELARGHAARAPVTGRIVSRAALPHPRPTSRPTRSRRSAALAGARLLPDAGWPRSPPPARRSLSRRRASRRRATSPPCSSSRCRTRNWKVAQAPRRESNIR